MFCMQAIHRHRHAGASQLSKKQSNTPPKWPSNTLAKQEKKNKRKLATSKQPQAQPPTAVNEDSDCTKSDFAKNEPNTI